MGWGAGGGEEDCSSTVLYVTLQVSLSSFAMRGRRGRGEISIFSPFESYPDETNTTPLPQAK